MWMSEIDDDKLAQVAICNDMMNTLCGHATALVESHWNGTEVLQPDDKEDRVVICLGDAVRLWCKQKCSVYKEIGGSDSQCRICDQSSRSVGKRFFTDIISARPRDTSAIRAVTLSLLLQSSCVTCENVPAVAGKPSVKNATERPPVAGKPSNGRQHKRPRYSYLARTEHS